MASKSQVEALFPGGVGNTQQDPARFSSLYSGVVAKIFDQLPDTTWVYPGPAGVWRFALLAVISRGDGGAER